MTNNEFENLLRKVENSNATAEEKLKLMKELNIRFEEYNSALKEALASVSEEK